MTLRATQFAELVPPPGCVVLLGDSITEGGLWHEWFPDVPLVNRGIGGNTVADVLARLDTAVVDPAAIFLLIGTNDLETGLAKDQVFARRPRLTPGQIAEGMRHLVSAIRERAPHADLFIQSVMPREPEVAGRLHELNAAYREIAKDADATYIDLWPALADETDGLRPAFTVDSLHLNGAGYAAWVEVLRPYVDGLDLGRGSGGERSGSAV
ncbi:GDSL-type esterase/lipase family protein [Yinghuangia sp. ASG 101]|uniref:GDSL-type esterase/lipase family protein n=1 Tax=Yinghuangia sp. ASG 101 TaxID=2896848 RepID=UPI001E361564|nr:GDSL-type esterase/lipase family protein [Yinghuangia sp. ASG 101]UGQ12331.1 GDSL-type esterase/lipase family protein [Yinghuangia sp. ASG 101]